MKIDKIWHRGIIKYLQKKGLAPKYIYPDVVATLGNDARALLTVKKWAAEFKRGRESLEDDLSFGRPASRTSQEKIDRVHYMVMHDRRLTVNQIADAVAIFCERVENVLHEELGMSKVSTRWVPCLLTPAQKHTKLVMSQENFSLFKTNPDSFLERFLIQDECWVHHFEAETKRQSMQWKHLSSPPPKKAKVVLSSGKIMASFFWDAKVIVFIDYLQKGRTMNREYYANLLRELRQAIKSKRPGKLIMGPVTPAQCSYTQVCGCNGCCGRL